VAGEEPPVTPAASRSGPFSVQYPELGQLTDREQAAGIPADTEVESEVMNPVIGLHRGAKGIDCIVPGNAVRVFGFTV
jgi:hypothetical protein